MAHCNPKYFGPYTSASEVEDMIKVPELHGLITRLHLQPGDILLVHDVDVLEQLMDDQMPTVFPVPIVFAPEGTISMMDYEKLMLLAAHQSELHEGGHHA